MGFVLGNGGPNPPVGSAPDGVPTTTEIRLTFDGFLDPGSISPEAIVLGSGELERATTLRWDFQAGPDFENRFDDERPHQVVAIRTTTPLDVDNQYRVVVTDGLRGLLGERVEPSERTFRTGSDPGGALPVEPPTAPPMPAQFFEGSLWSQSDLGCRSDPPPAECLASCGWGVGPCHRMLDPGLVYDPAFVDFDHPDPAMDLVLCTLDEGGFCTTTYEAPEPFKDLYDPSGQWPSWRIVDPGRPETSYLLYKLLGVPGIDGGPMPRDRATRGHDPYIAPDSYCSSGSCRNRSNFVAVAQAIRQWIAAGAPDGS